jgi:DNA-directed RNA polymerase delta subunit
VATGIKKNPFGKWGISHWKEINPKGTREKVYLVLKEKKEPLHFTQIAELIDKYKLSKKRAHPQTVHNELIKDEKFILIGRGTYALREWGYFSGTVREVLKSILSQSRKPLTKEEILTQVTKMRKVKKATIMINLNNPKFFCKQENFYTLNK